MKNFLRVFIVIALTLALTTVFTGCGSNDSGNNSGSLNYTLNDFKKDFYENQNNNSGIREQTQNNRDLYNSMMNNANNNNNNNNNNSNTSGSVNTVTIGGNNNGGYDGRYDNNTSSSQSSSGTWKPQSAQITTNNNSSNSSSNSSNSNNNSNSSSGTWKPQSAQVNSGSSSSSSSSSGRVSLDTTGSYSGLRLKAISTRNDTICYEINKNTSNMVSSLTGNEAPLKTAVALFNALKNENASALNNLYYSSSSKSDLSGYSEKFVAYKVLEYHKFSQSETDKIEKSARTLYNIPTSSDITGYYRVSFKVYKYDEAPSSLYDSGIYDADPYHLRVTLIEVDGTPYILSYMTAK